MHIYVDADACPVVDIIEDKARKYKEGTPAEPAFKNLI